MAGIHALHSVGNSLVTYLRNTYPAQVDGRDMPACSFELLSSGELAGTVPENTRLTLYLYRITVNEHSRQARAPQRAADRLAPLGLDLHFMLTAWSGSAQDELITLAWAMRQLYQHPILDASSLSPEARWGSDEVIQIIPAELATEEMMRIWDAFDPAYRLSVSYIARLVRIDPELSPTATRVVATRMVHGTASEGAAP
jgi:hypothetical protein